MSDSEWTVPDGPDESPGGAHAAGPSRLQRRRRGPLLPTLLVLATLALLATAASGVWTDILWYRSVGFSTVFTTNLLTRIVLGAVGFLLVAGLVGGGLVFAYRQRPVYAPSPEANESLEQYRVAIEPVRRLAALVIPLILGVLGATAASGMWRTYLAWANRTPFGTKDPQFGRDVSFFVFTVPWLQAVISFLTMTLVIALAAAAFTHYIYGGLQLPGRGPTTRAALVHVSVLGALLALTRAAAYWVDRYALATKESPLMTGIRYADSHAVLPAKLILAVAAVIVAVLFLGAILTRSWRLPIIGVAMLLITSVVVGGIYPAVIQSLRVRPSEKSLEAPFLQRNITATRAAYGLDKVQVKPYRVRTDAAPGQLRDDAATIPGIRLVDPIVVAPTFRQLEALRSFYTFPDALDVDRYQIDGKESDVVVAVRELSLEQVAGGLRNWLNDHTVYTHGFGLVAAYGNKRGSDGQPVFAVRNIPPTGVLGEFEPRVYFGEQSPQYSVVGSAAGAAPREFDYPDDASPQGQKNNTYSGRGGVPIGSLLRQAAYAVKYREFNFLLSDAVGKDSRILDHRRPLERVQRVAPWLTLDGNPYPAVVDGRIQWIVDGYTTSANYPYSQLENLDSATSDSTTRSATSVSAIRAGQVNYIRNSVKATVDAFDGTVHLYAWDESDPVMRTWAKAYPGTVEPLANISGSLMQHLRYPEDLFKVQRTMLARYHVTEAASFYGRADFWRVPQDPAQSAQVYQPPYYLTLAVPGQEQPTFSLTTTFMPIGDRQVLSGFLSVEADAGATTGRRSEGYGALRLLELPRDSNVKGPAQVQNDIRSSNDNSPGFALTLSQFLNNNQQGSKLTFGNLLTLPVGGGLLYVQPIYVSAQSESSYPLSRVTVAAFGDKLAWSDTLTGALDQLFGGNSGADAGDSGSGTSTPPTPDGQEPDAKAALNTALADMQKAFDDGKKALADGDFTAYGQAQERLQEALDRAVKAAPEGSLDAGAGGGTGG